MDKKNIFFKKVSFLLLSIIFVSINLQLFATDAARKKIEEILKKTGTTEITKNNNYHIDISPNGESIKVYGVTTNIF